MKGKECDNQCNHQSLFFFSIELIKRLDDVSRSVRMKASQVLTVLFMDLPEGYDIALNSAHLQDLCQDALIFLDDPDVELQKAVSGE